MSGLLACPRQLLDLEGKIRKISRTYKSGLLRFIPLIHRLHSTKEDRMRRSLFTLLIPILYLFGCMSHEEATKEEMNHEFIIAFPGLQKQQIFDGTLKWIANNFQSAKAVIEYQDKESGSIIGNGNVPFTAEGAWVEGNLSFTMNVDTKDEKARIRFINLMYSKIGTEPIPNTRAYHIPAQKKFSQLVESLTAFVSRKDEF
jgi:hypothetical protein